MRPARPAPIVVLALLLVAGCSSLGHREDSGPTISSARAELRNLNGQSVGEVHLRQLATGVLVSGTLTNMPPGAHGIHVHAIGQCTPPFESAGGHYAPDDHVHGFENAKGPHAGDLPNIYVPESGVLRFEYVTPRFSLGGRQPLLDSDGAAVVIHNYADDYRTEPSGNSGARIACGVIVR